MSKSSNSELNKNGRKIILAMITKVVCTNFFYLGGILLFGKLC